MISSQNTTPYSSKGSHLLLDLQQAVIIFVLFSYQLLVWFVKLGWPYVPVFPNVPWPGFLYCLNYLGFGFVCMCRPIGEWHQSIIQTVLYAFKMLSRYFDVKPWSVWAAPLLSRTHLICMRNCIALTVDPTFSHTHDCFIMYNACMLLVKLLWSLPSASMKTKPKHIVWKNGTYS